MIELMKYFRMIESSSWLKCCLYAIVIIAAYHSVLRLMIFHDWLLEDNSYCYLIPFVVIYFIWKKRAVLASVWSCPSWAGLIPFAMGVAFFWLGELGGELFTQYISLWFIIVGLCWLHLGWKKIKTIWFALIMMLAMFPLPNFVNVWISLYLRLISSQIGNRMLHLYGMPSYREGNVIDIGLIQLHVVDACSGLRYLIPLMVLSLILAYGFKTRFWKRAVLFLSFVPIAIFVNSFRIALTGILYDIWGPGVAEGFFHGFSGWLIFMVTIPILFLEMWILNKVGRKQAATEVTPAIADNKGIAALPAGARNDEKVIATQSLRGIDNIAKIPLNPPLKKEEISWKGFLRPPQFIVAVVLLLLTLGISSGVEFREKIPVSKSFAQFPLRIGEWQGTPQMMEQQFIDVLHFSDYIMMNYQNPQGQDVDFYVAYYESQRKGETAHSPETCLSGSGWTFEQSGRAVFPLNNGQIMKTNRAFISKSGMKQLTYFWFPQRDRILTSLVQVKLYSFWDALTRQRTDGALVRIITPIYPNEEEMDAEARLQGFTKQVVPVLNGFMPK